MISENLNHIRLEKGLSRPKLANMADLNIRTIEFIEWGKIKNPCIDTVEKLAKALDVTINDLIK